MVLALRSALGMVALLGLAWALSERRRAVRPRLLLVGLAAQLLLALLVLRAPWAQDGFAAVGHAVQALQEATARGTSVVFGYLGGGPLPFEETRPGSAFILAFRALPLVIVMSALAAVLTYWRVLPALVRGLSFLLERAFGLRGAVGLATAANVFVGMVEAPVLVRGYLKDMTRAELFILMTAGMATVSGTVLAFYAQVLAPVVPDAAGHLLAASVMSAPAAVTIALLMVPETAPAARAAAPTAAIPRGATSAMDAITQGTRAGLEIYLVVLATLIVLVALVHLVNLLLGLVPGPGDLGLSLERMLGWAMAPVAWLMGIPWREAPAAGALLGTKTVLNEFLAYLDLSRLPPDALSPRSRLILTYALCGFANPGSLGILLGGLTVAVPERRVEIVALGARSIVAGTLATCLTGAAVGLLTPPG